LRRASGIVLLRVRVALYLDQDNPTSFHRETWMRGTASLIKIGALFCAAIFAVPNSKSAFAQNRSAGNFGRPAGSFQGRPGVAPNRGFGNFGHFGDSFGRSRFGAGFDRGRRDFGTNIVVVPSAVAPAPYYGVPPLGYDSLRCILHRPVQTPHGEVLEPVYVC
jgi:hypothetical protein